MTIQQVAVLALVLGVIAVVIVITVSIRGHTWLSETGEFWMPRLERWRFLSRWRRSGLSPDGGIRRVSNATAFKHCSVISPSGSGKSTIFCLGNLLTASGRDSYFVFDSSGELHARSAGYLNSKGLEISVLNVANVERSLTWNPLTRCRSETDIQAIASTLVNASLDDSSGANSFWNSSAIDLISTLLRVILSLSDPKYHTIGNLRHMLNFVGDESLDQLVLRTATDTVWTDFMAIRRYSEKVLLSIVATCRSALQPFSDQSLVRLTSSESLNFERLRSRASALFIQVPEHQTELYGFLTAILYQQVFDFLMEPPKKNEPYLNIFGLLDEFGSVAAIKNFSGFLVALRKRATSLTILTQDSAQIESKYGRAEATTILAGCATKLYLGGMSQQMCAEVSSALGTENVEGERSSLLTPQEIRTMPENRAICISSNKRPILLRTRPFYRSRKLRRRSRIAPPAIPVAENIEPAFLNLQRDEQSTRPLPALQIDKLTGSTATVK